MSRGMQPPSLAESSRVARVMGLRLIVSVLMPVGVAQVQRRAERFMVHRIEGCGDIRSHGIPRVS